MANTVVKLCVCACVRACVRVCVCTATRQLQHIQYLICQQPTLIPDPYPVPVCCVAEFQVLVFDELEPGS